MVEYKYIDRANEGQIKQIIDLYRQAGWWAKSGEDGGLVLRLLKGSHCFLIALDGEGLVGMGRAISDGASDAYIQDVTVHRDYRGRGIGSQIILNLIERLRQDGIKWIGLIAEKNSSPFYRQIGFNVMPDSVPMVLLKDEQISTIETC